MTKQPEPGRRTAQEVATAIREVAKQYKDSSRGSFLAALAATIATGEVRTGSAEGRYRMASSPNGVTVQCENAAQTGWVETVCRTVKINFLTPTGRAHERELHISR